MAWRRTPKNWRLSVTFPPLQPLRILGASLAWWGITVSSWRDSLSLPDPFTNCYLAIDRRIRPSRNYGPKNVTRPLSNWSPPWPPPLSSNTRISASLSSWKWMPAIRNSVLCYRMTWARALVVDSGAMRRVCKATLRSSWSCWVSRGLSVKSSAATYGERTSRYSQTTTPCDTFILPSWELQCSDGWQNWRHIISPWSNALQKRTGMPMHCLEITSGCLIQRTLRRSVTQYGVIGGFPLLGSQRLLQFLFRVLPQAPVYPSHTPRSC